MKMFYFHFPLSAIPEIPLLVTHSHGLTNVFSGFSYFKFRSTQEYNSLKHTHYTNNFVK